MPAADAIFRGTMSADYAGTAGETGLHYALVRATDQTTDVATVDPVTGQFGPPLCSVTHNNNFELVFSYGHRQLEGVRDGANFHWFSPERAKVQAMINAALPGTCNAIKSTSEDGSCLLIEATSDSNPGSWYYLNRAAKQIKILAKEGFPNLQPTTEVTYAARDGLSLPALVTRPAGAAGKHCPMVVLLHDGAFDWGYFHTFNPLVQYLVRRGYAVLQPAYRGSAGAGRGLIEAGRHEWGRKIQTDVDDGTQWAIREGIADSDRICLWGTGYGGYIALMGLVQRPDLYRCAINDSGLTDLRLLDNRHELFHSSSDSWTYFFRDWLGTEDLGERSPVMHAKEIKRPVFNSYASFESFANPGQWEGFRDALDHAHVPYEVYRPEFIHGVQFIDNGFGFLRAAEAFLGRNLPAGAARP